jgi:hypothetical protein
MLSDLVYQHRPDLSINMCDVRREGAALYYGYRFVEKSGRYHAYIKMHRHDFPEIRITERASDALAIHVLDGRIEFPKQWALMEIREMRISSMPPALRRR